MPLGICHVYSPVPPHPTPTSTQYEVLADTAAAHDFLEEEALKYCSNVAPATGTMLQVDNRNEIAHQSQGKKYP